jgi:hypothetical protein
MKLQTIMRIDGKFTAAVGDDEDMSHDAACAHALMLAMGEFYAAPLDSSLETPEDTLNWLEWRASEIMREWGFDSGEDAS